MFLTSFDQGFYSNPFSGMLFRIFEDFLSPFWNFSFGLRNIKIIWINFFLSDMMNSQRLEESEISSDKNHRIVPEARLFSSCS
jgi:hypothetical protein